MRRLYTTILTLAFLIPVLVSAQTKDSIEMGAGYSNDVYYSFENGQVKKEANNNWDLGFRTGFRTDGIFINSVSSSTPGAGRNVSLYLYPKSDISGWSTFDTSGISVAPWPEFDNTDTSWEFGAFNRQVGAFPDFSWGIYNPVTKIVEGDSLYLLKIVSGANTYYKKLQIIDKNFGVWHFRYANVDGTNEVSDSIVTSSSAAKLLDYYSIIDEAQVSREPDSLKDWDIMFTRYEEFGAGGGNVYYPVTGVFSKLGVRVAEVRNVDLTTFNYTTLNDTDYKVNKSQIGSDWKQFDNGTFQWTIEDSLAYFVKLQNGAIWRLEFEKFGGSGNGRVVFRKTKVQNATGIKNPVAPVASFNVYPNPTKGDMTLVYENLDNSVKNTLSIFDMTGKLIESHSLESAPGFYTTPLSVAHLPSGLYIVTLENAGYKVSQKLIKE